MRGFLWGLTLFILGFIVCAVTLRGLYGMPAMPWSGNKQVALTNLEGKAARLPHFTGDTAVREAAAKVEAAVVDVHTEGRAIQTDNPFNGNPFGGGDQPRYRIPKGAGSGVIISDDGYILTNNHVIEDTTKVQVNVRETGYTARVVGADPTTDIAVVKIDPKGKLPVAELGDSNEVRVGDWAIAVGNPLDIGITVTLGIISAINRKDLSAQDHPLGTVIQTDAAINPGNSGGALANIQGQVIGINEAIYSPTGASIGIGFAIPINQAKKIAAEIIKNGKVIRPYLGIAYAPLKGVPPQARKDLGITVTGDEGIVVSQVAPNSPAAEAGLQTYDVILEVNRKKLNDENALNELVSNAKIGDTLALLVSRNGQDRIMTAKLRERPSNFNVAPPHSQTPQPLTPQLP